LILGTRSARSFSRFVAQPPRRERCAVDVAAKGENESRGRNMRSVQAGGQRYRFVRRFADIRSRRPARPRRGRSAAAGCR
jgi:hypothetical protein